MAKHLYEPPVTEVEAAVLSQLVCTSNEPIVPGDEMDW